MQCRICNDELPPETKFCISCGAAQGVTGPTERLEREPRGYLNGEPIYEYDREIWSDPHFVTAIVLRERLERLLNDPR